MGLHDSVLAELRQRDGRPGDVALDPPVRDPARRVGGLTVTKEILDDVSTDEVTAEKLADRVGSGLLSRYGKSPVSIRFTLAGGI
jgi:hypothetical protein